MLIGLILLLAPLLYSLFLFCSYYPIFLAFTYGYVLFWTVNAFLLFLSRFIGPINLFVIFAVHLLLIILLAFLKKKKSRPQFDIKDVASFVAILVSTILFIVASSHYSSIVPVPSGSWDMAVHYLFVTNIFNNGSASALLYPYGFHGNAAIFIKSISLIAHKNNGIVVNISSFAVYIYIVLALLSGIFVYLLFLLTEKKENHISRIVNVQYVVGFVVPLLFYISYVIYLLWEGFMSVLFFNTILLFFIILEIKADDERVDKKYTNYFISMVIFLLGISYYYYFPVFFMYFVTRYVITKKNKYILYGCVYSLSCFDLIWRIIPQFSYFSGISRHYGWFEPFSVQIVSLFIIGSICYFLAKKKHVIGVINILLIYFLSLCLGMGIGTVFLGFDPYLVFKAFLPPFELCILLTGVIFMNAWRRVSEGKWFSHIVSYTLLSVIASVFIFCISNPRLPGIYAFINGGLSFFSGNKGVRQNYLTAWKNSSSYDVIIPIEENLNRLRWWTSILKEKTPLFRRMSDSYDQLHDLSYYSKEVGLLQNKKILVIDANNNLVKACKYSFVENLLLSKNKIDFIPPLSNDAFNKCK